MMRRLILMTAFLLAGCGTISRADFEEDLGIVLATPSAPMATATASRIPTATVDYQATAVIAQQTADEARRLNTAATAAFEVRVHEQVQLTAEAERRAFEVYGWTATARWTSVPATQTQQAILNTQIPAQQALLAGQLTATHEAPTMVAAMARSESEARFAPLRAGVEIFGLFSLGVFLLFLVWFVLKIRPTLTPAPISSGEAVEVDVTRVDVVDRSHGLRINRFEVPCSAEALTALAEGLINEGKTLAINQWEGAENIFSRNTFMPVRNFLLMNRFARSNGAGMLVLTDGGEVFLRGWLETRALPHSFEFDGEDARSDEDASHGYESHGMSHGAGELQAADI